MVPPSVALVVSTSGTASVTVTVWVARQAERSADSNLAQPPARCSDLLEPFRLDAHHIGAGISGWERYIPHSTSVVRLPGIPLSISMTNTVAPYDAAALVGDSSEDAGIALRKRQLLAKQNYSQSYRQQLEHVHRTPATESPLIEFKELISGPPVERWLV